MLTPPIVRSVQDVADTLRTAQRRTGHDAWGGVTLLVGAGWSRSAGIPLADAIARELTLELARTLSFDAETFADADAALRWLTEHDKLARDLQWPQVYGHLFERHYKDATTQRRIIARFVDAAT